MYSTPLMYKSLDSATPLDDNAEESSTKAEATNFNPIHYQDIPNCQWVFYLDKRTSFSHVHLHYHPKYPTG